MKTTFTEENGNYVMAFEGRLDTSASMQVGKDMNVLNDCNGHDIILDCTHLDYISSSGLRLFLGVLKNARAQGRRVFIRGMKDEIHAVFKEIGFSSIFEFV
jgi:anti-sigma B factor antagonist